MYRIVKNAKRGEFGKEKAGITRSLIDTFVTDVPAF